MYTYRLNFGGFKDTVQLLIFGISHVPQTNDMDSQFYIREAFAHAMRLKKQLYYYITLRFAALEKKSVLNQRYNFGRG